MTTERDYALKLRRAYEYLTQLNGAVGAWTNGNHHSIRVEPGRQSGYVLVKATAEAPPRDPFSLLIGDCLHNMRSCLDLLAYELAIAYTVPLPSNIEETSEFPIFGDVDRRGASGAGPGMFRDNGRHKIRGIDPAAQTVIETLQPYKRGSAFNTHPLWLLHDLDRINKHRLLHPVIAFSTGLLLNPSRSRNVALGPGTIEVCGGIVEQDTQIARLPARPAVRGEKMYVEVDAALEVAFERGVPGVELQPVMEVLTGIYNYIVTEVLPALAPFVAE